MSINKVNTTVEEQSFKFLTNQSSILHTVDTNKITINGVNVIVDKPKRGDVMCITHYKEGGVLLDADKQKVVCRFERGQNARYIICVLLAR